MLSVGSKECLKKMLAAYLMKLREGSVYFFQDIWLTFYMVFNMS